MKKLFVVSMSIMVAVTPITANAATNNDVRMKGLIPAPKITSSVTANSETNDKEVFGKYHAIINGSSGNKDSNNKIRYHVRLEPSYGLLSGCNAYVYGYCTKISTGNRIAARFDTTFTFKTPDGKHEIDNDGTVTSSKTKDACENGYLDDVVKSVKTKTTCSKKTYETKDISLSSTNPYNK